MIDSSNFYLSCNGTWEDFPEIVDLLKPDYHDSFSLMWYTWEQMLAHAEDGGRSLIQHRERLEKERPELKDCPEYHLHNVVKLHFSDGDMSLNHDNDALMHQFIKDFGLTIDFSGIKKQKRELEERLASVNTLLAEIHGKHASGH